MSVVVMSRNGSKQQSFCGEPQCMGPSCQLCQALKESAVIHESIQCPHKDPSCCQRHQCDLCKAIAESLVETREMAVGGGKASDVVPLQPVRGCSSNQEECEECRKPLGSNTRSCSFCASFAESPLNPNQPNIRYNDDFGPVKGSFGPYTPERNQRYLASLKTMFEVAQLKHGTQFPEINGTRATASRITQLLSQGCVLGIEGMNNSCFGVVSIWILSQGITYTRIRTDCFAGYILYKVLRELRTRLFVGRDLVDAFRLSLEEYPKIRGIIEFGEMDDPILLLSLLEEVGILTKGPIFSKIGCSFILNEYKLEGQPPVSSIQDAMIYSYANNSQGSPVPENGSILSLQLCQQRPNQPFTKQILGTELEFPHDGVSLMGKLLRLKMFIIYHSRHYLVVLCVGEAFFLSNSLSASQCGHFLPETREISKQEAMRLFKEQAHTIVFECVGDVPQSQASSASGHLVPQSQPQVPCVSSGYVPPPPPPLASCAQVAQALPPTPPPQQFPCANVAQAFQPPPPAFPVVWFETDYRIYDPEKKVLRSRLTGRIIDDIRAGYYDVREKETHRMIRIELREVLSDDALPPTAPRAQVFSQIQLADITIHDGEWSFRRNSFFKNGTCVVSLNQFTIDRIIYDQNGFLTFLNVLYNVHCNKQ